MIRALHWQDGAIQEVAVDQVAALARDKARAGLLWVDIEGEPEEPSRDLLEKGFGFHYLAVDDCLNVRVDMPKLDDYDSYLFIVGQRLAYDDENDELHSAEIDLFLGDNYVVTYHDQRFPELEEVGDRMLEGVHRTERGADFLARTILDVVVDEYLPVVEMIQEDADRLEDMVVANPSPACLEATRTLRRNATQLRRALGPMRDVLNRLSRGEFPTLVQAEHQIYFRDVYDHVARVEELTVVIREQADLALTSYLSVTNNRLNSAMRVLAIISVIFLPPTLIAGVFGTNFEENLPYGESWGVLFMFVLFVVVDLLVIAFLRMRRLI
ncbi:MAG TPA: magnesium/cobalt transporter CorA [Dehalococcoidia bacterium]|nr:magnesium/cobalt transporter CorA [Dehalococcoidia bacterium]